MFYWYPDSAFLWLTPLLPFQQRASRWWDYFQLKFKMTFYAAGNGSILSLHHVFRNPSAWEETSRTKAAILHTISYFVTHLCKYLRTNNPNYWGCSLYDCGHQQEHETDSYPIASLITFISQTHLNIEFCFAALFVSFWVPLFFFAGKKQTVVKRLKRTIGMCPITIYWNSDTHPLGLIYWLPKPLVVRSQNSAWIACF